MESEKGFEIDFLPVGDSSKSGDAIAIRYGNLNSYNSFYQRVIVIDGGNTESGQKLVDHIKTLYNTNRVDLVINTHPDNDHCCGLREVLNNLEVGELWIHSPWNYATEFVGLFRDGRITDNSLRERLREAMNIAHELEKTALQKGISVREPFEGITFDNGIIEVLGPTKNYYSGLLPNYRSTPEPIVASSFSRGYTAVKEAVSWALESIEIETLNDSGETSAENNSSAICLFNFDGQKVLFTGDSGMPALTNALSYAKSRGIGLNDLKVFQVPHHGSKRNIGPTLLNEIKGNSAYVSCARNGEPKHPAKKVTNALIRRGANVYQTKGNILCHRHNTPMRNGYSSATAIPFFEKVED